MWRGSDGGKSRPVWCIHSQGREKGRREEGEGERQREEEVRERRERLDRGTLHKWTKVIPNI